jgi:predicted nucleotidyltransferase
MITVERKNRIREYRGELRFFDNLPLVHQNNFKLIKNKINDALKEHTDVYVFGSFFWGSWDDFSDYDVKINYVHNSFKPDLRYLTLKEVENELTTLLGKKVDVLIMRGNQGILIP